MKISIIFFLLIFNFNTKAGLHPSILMFNEWDFKSCPRQVKKVISFNVKKVNIVPTLHYINDQSKKIHKFCVNSTNKNCESIDHQFISKFKTYLINCFKPLIKNNIQIMITPHLDDGTNQGIWRNEVLFDPLKKYSNGLSYYEIMIRPIVEALKETNIATKNVEFSMQGEMGATIFYAPKSYRIIKNYIKSELRKTLVGFSLNYNHINGYYENFNLNEIQSLVKEVDFIGISAYRPINILNNEITDQPFQNTVFEFIQQFKNLNILIPWHKKIVFSEVGIGGGNALNDGITEGKDINEIASVPHSGVYHYRGNPWLRADFSHFRREYYKEMVRFLNYQYIKFTNPVIDAYIWNADSWDVLGLYPRSLPYKDDYILNNYLTRR